MKKLMLFALTLIAGSCGYAGAVIAQAYPDKPIRVIIPFPPGEAADIIARLLAPVMSEHMGQQVVVDNRAGASGQIGLELLKNATPDGYTIGVGQGGNLVVAPHTYKKLPYDPLKDFAAIALNATNYLAVVANPSAVVLGADTEVVLDDEVFGKPADADDAARMLAVLSGRTHRVVSTVWLVSAGRELHATSISEVTFESLTPERIAAYIAGGECFGKAGAYAIQGRAGAFVSHLSGSFTGVMGLPLHETARLLRGFGLID